VPHSSHVYFGVIKLHQTTQAQSVASVEDSSVSGYILGSLINRNCPECKKPSTAVLSMRNVARSSRRQCLTSSEAWTHSLRVVVQSRVFGTGVLHRIEWDRPFHDASRCFTALLLTALWKAIRCLSLHSTVWSERRQRDRA
jgi:hypothetical protein